MIQENGAIDPASVPAGSDFVSFIWEAHHNATPFDPEVMKPVVAFDCGKTKDELIRHMVTGILVKNGDIKEMATRMLFLYNNPTIARSIGDEARQFIVKNRSWEQRIKIELQIYDDLISK